MRKTVESMLLALACLFLVACFTSCKSVASPTVVETYPEIVSSEPGEGRNVYFAAPLFSHAEKKFNLELTHVLEEYGYTVFLPQRDGIETALLEGKTEEELIRMIFDKDYTEVMKADIIFVMLDGRVPDEGACVELGIAFASGKRCYAVKTDTRSVEKNLDINPMITGCLVKLFADYDGENLIKTLDQYLSENEL